MGVLCAYMCVCACGGGGMGPTSHACTHPPTHSTQTHTRTHTQTGYWLPGRDIDVRMEEDENVYLQRPIASQEEESHLQWKRTHGNKTRVRTRSMPCIQSSPKHNK